MDQTGNPSGLDVGRGRNSGPGPGGPGSGRPNPPGPGPIPIPQPVQDIIQVNNAIIENIEISPQFSTVTIVYEARNQWNQLVTQRVRLVITNETIILNQLGVRIGIWGLRIGMRVIARFSSRFTRSYPPQSQAYFIRIIGFQR